ncbi:MAG TPA: glycosyl hydrolase family 18 protein, partial [Chloroflexota bacterium]|nr:glycosyl hydrolase family 18 protein [Chloroflexota bacterium]
STSWASLQTHVHDLDIVAAQWVRIDACGNLGSTDDQTLKEFARQNNVLVLPSLFTLSAPLNHLILTDEQARANAIQGIASYTVGEDYAGFDLDLEGVDPTDRDAFTAYVADLATALHEQNKMLTLALPAKDRDVTVGWSGAYDYAALGASADLVTIMAYEYSGPFSGPGSVAPYEWVARVMAFARSQIAPEKLVLGAAWYGYDWNTTSGGALSLGYPQALALAEHFGASLELDPLTRSATFAYETVAGGPMPRVASPPRLNHRVTERQPPPCDVAPPPAPTPVATPERPAAAGEPQSHAVWVEDSAAFVERVGLAERFGVAGIATWRLGQEDPRVWGAVQQWRSTKEE